MRLLIIWLIVFLFFGCGSKMDRHKNEEKLDQLYELFDDLGKPDHEKIALLSLKYNIDEIKVENILDEYLSKHDSDYQYLKYFENILSEKEDVSRPKIETKKNFQETLKDIGIKYNIPIEKIACLIIDYKIWRECEHRGEY